MKHYANLHNHSTHSDGVYSPAQLVKVAAEEGYQAVVLTDHDTVTGYAEMAAACGQLGLETLFGTEFSSPCDALGTDFHITAYGFDPEYPAMRVYLDQLSARETHQTRVLFQRGLDLGLLSGITWEEVLEYNEGISWLCNEHVFRALRAKGLMTDLDYPEFFQSVYGPHRNEVPDLYPFCQTPELIKQIHEAGGIALVAHPHNRLQHIGQLKQWGIDGIEVWHGDLPDSAERREALRLAGVYDLYVSGGADHSGLCGGQYSRYQHPEETVFWLEPCSVGTTEYFFTEIRDRKKHPDRQAVIASLLDSPDI